MNKLFAASQIVRQSIGLDNMLLSTISTKHFGPIGFTLRPPPLRQHFAAAAAAASRAAGELGRNKHGAAGRHGLNLCSFYWRWSCNNQYLRRYKTRFYWVRLDL